MALPQDLAVNLEPDLTVVDIRLWEVTQVPAQFSCSLLSPESEQALHPDAGLGAGSTHHWAVFCLTPVHACTFTSSSPMCRVELASLYSLRSMLLASNQSLLTGLTWASSDLNCSRTGQPGPQLQPSLALVKPFNVGVMTGIET